MAWLVVVLRVETIEMMMDGGLDRRIFLLSVMGDCLGHVFLFFCFSR